MWRGAGEGGMRWRWGGGQVEAKDLCWTPWHLCSPPPPPNPLPAPPLVLPHPLLSTLTCRPLLPSEPGVSGKPLAHTGEDPGASRTQTSQEAGERRARAWVRARAGQIGGTFRGSFISSRNLARLLPALCPSPHGSHGPRLTFPGYPASLDPWKQV